MMYKHTPPLLAAAMSGPMTIQSLHVRLTAMMTTISICSISEALQTASHVSCAPQSIRACPALPSLLLNNTHPLHRCRLPPGCAPSLACSLPPWTAAVPRRRCPGQWWPLSMRSSRCAASQLCHAAAVVLPNPGQFRLLDFFSTVFALVEGRRWGAGDATTVTHPEGHH
jgi:hypothetical protein